MPSLAVAPVDDLSTWARSSGLLIVLYLLGAVLLTRFVSWLGERVTTRIDVNATGSDALVRSEAAKHRHAVAQVITWASIVLIYFVTGVVVADRLGIPLTSLVAPATVAGVALGFGAQRVVQDLLAGFFLIAERQYGFGDLIRISALGSTEGVSGTVEDVTLRITRIRSSNGEVVIVPNGQIVQVTNLSRDWARAVVDVPLPPTVDVTKATDSCARPPRRRTGTRS
jgi:small-conductance mechanosensitive channel